MSIEFETQSLANGRFLLIFGNEYYPSSGLGDWYGLYKTREGALKDAKALLAERNKNVEDWWATIVELTDE